jgi:aminoglycoside phosphotransferase (APT) family kinase protein
MEAMEPDVGDRLLNAVRRRFGRGCRVKILDRPTVGGSNQTIVFDLVERTARRRLVLRAETYTAPDSPFLDPAMQFRLLEVAGRHAVPVPEPVFALEDGDGLGRGFVMAYVEGETVPQKILREPRFDKVVSRLACELGETLARVHAIPLAEVAFLDSLSDSADVITAHRRRFDTYDEPHPAIELGLRWLELHRPPPAARTLLHGDFRNGNFIITEAGVAAVLDWECAHLGDPMEDLAWVCNRSWRFSRPDRAVGGFGSRSDLYSAYQTAGGLPPDPDLIHYWDVFAFVRWAILSVMQGHGHVFGGRCSMVYAASGRNVPIIEQDLLRALTGSLG